MNKLLALMITSDEFGAGLVPRGHQLGQPGEPGPQRNVLGGQAGGAATRNGGKIRPGCIYSE